MPSQDPLAAAKADLKPAFKPQDFSVFVFGPALGSIPVLEPTSPVSDHAQVVEHARYLRYLTKKRLEELDFRADFGEAKDVFKFWSEFFSAPDVASTEILHANKACGAVIIFPASFGSIAELALSARHPRIAAKTVAIVHEAYSDAASFFRRGILEIFDDHDGKMRFVNYANHNACIERAVRYVRGKFSRLLGEADEVMEIQRRHKGTVFEHAFKGGAD